MAKTGATIEFWPILGARSRAFSGERQRGQAMAEQEMKAASETYSGFLSLFKVGAIASAVVAIIVVLLIS
ncbi:aa3-type cytochrome c oxidase subunit IV [Sphingopyxis lindanitolerans]|nr:aa3-type cytochrome c oxidase subunit IV [Sphingopyxis lindanitolerans]